jgi:hypothetical protein
MLNNYKNNCALNTNLMHKLSFIHMMLQFPYVFRPINAHLQEVRRSYSYNKSQKDALFLNFILVKNSTCFGQAYCPSSGVLILYSQQLVFVVLVMLTVR